MPWETGDQILMRYWVRGKAGPQHGAPVTVVRDDPDCIAVFQAAGTPSKAPRRLDGTEILRSLPFPERYNTPTRVVDDVWHTESRLMLVRPGAAHAFSVFWLAEDWSFQGWYVDLQAPFRRTSLGFDSEDHVLDIVVGADLSWYWKDEDELADAQRIGRFTPEEAAAIRAEGERVVEVIEAGGWPFNEGWESWRPDPDWPIPAVPEGWDRV